MGKLTHRTAHACTYFVTTKTWENREIFRVIVNAEIVMKCLLDYRDHGAYRLHEFVIMPNHLHLLLTPAKQSSLEKAMQFIKGGSSHAIHVKRENRIQVWQSGFHEWTVRDVRDYEAKRDYIWQNPVTCNLVNKPAEWKFGSAFGKYALDPMPERLKDGFRG